MMFAILVTVLVAALGHAVILAMVRHLPRYRALRVYWMAVGAGLLVIASSGCGPIMGFGGSKERPNRPGWGEMGHETYDPVTGKRTWGYVRGLGAENSDEPMTGRVDESGAGYNSGTSAPFKWSAVTSNPAALFGCILFVAGIALLVVGKFPIAGFVIPGGAGWTCILGGAGLIALPFIAEALKPVITIAAVLGGIGFAIYYGHKLKWFEKATDTDAMWDRVDKGDLAGAATLAYLGGHGKSEAKMKARALKRNGNGNGGHAVPAAPPVDPLAIPPMPVVPLMPTVDMPTQPGG